MRSATPKVLHPLAGRSLVEHAVRAAAGIKPEHMVVVVGHSRTRVVEHLHEVAGRIGTPVLTAVQEKQRGTGHAVACGLGALPEDLAGTVLVTYGDVPLLDTATLENLLDRHSAEGNAVTVLTASVADPTGYGRITRDGSGEVIGIVEHRDATDEQLRITEINSGVYAFAAEVLRPAIDRLEAHNANQELYLTDVLSIARADGLRVGSVRCPDPVLVRGVNDRVQLAGMARELNSRLLERWMLSGVTVIDPCSVWIDADVTLAQDVVLEPGTQLRGHTEIGVGSVIGPDTTLIDCKVGANCSVIKAHALESELGDEVSVGPYAYLRPKSRLADKAKLGTFVETKNVTIGEGSKVPHLTYVGDATIGEYSNIGASSVFVNYDGVTKSHTTIGSYCKTGSDNMFVAPVAVGDGAYTGAGTVVRRDVPPGALAVSGGPQRNIEEWVLTRRNGTPSAEAASRALRRYGNDVPEGGETSG
jgi:bifunctional UDP-N-acetylglucosamine pyrophosphorylase/glucosamine-1-phosphate N-acetyltransferase